MNKKLVQLKLYNEKDSDFTVYSRFNDVIFPEKDKIISVTNGYLCITNKAITPNARGKLLIGQFEMALPYLQWFLGVKARFALSPEQGGYPPGEMSDIIQLDPDNELYVFRGAHFGNRGLMRFALENRKRSSYIAEGVKQSTDLYDVYFDECGLLDTFLKIPKDFEDGKI